MEPDDARARAALYRSLFRDALDHLDSTRRIEWLVSSALWAGIALAGAKFAGTVSIASWPLCAIIAAAAAAALLHGVLWMWPMKASEDATRAESYFYLDLMYLALLGQDPLPARDGSPELRERVKRARKAHIGRRPDFRDGRWFYRLFGGWGWVVLECVTTGALAAGVLILLKFVPVHSAPAAP